MYVEALENILTTIRRIISIHIYVYMYTCLYIYIYVYIYILGAMEDILTTIRELCIANCVEILPTTLENINTNDNNTPPEPLDLPSILLEAYSSHPKASTGIYIYICMYI
jgi:hypothetical protein